MSTPAFSFQTKRESRNVEVSKILKTWWEGQSGKEPGVDDGEGKEG